MSWDSTFDESNDGERAKRYRQRAAELRAVAEWMREPPAVKQILATAFEYERMAETIEKIARDQNPDRDLNSSPRDCEN